MNTIVKNDEPLSYGNHHISNFKLNNLQLRCKYTTIRRLIRQEILDSCSYPYIDNIIMLTISGFNCVINYNILSCYNKIPHNEENTQCVPHMCNKRMQYW